MQWLFDTGSDVSVLPEAIANQFALRPAGVGTVAQGIGGGLRLLPRKGITVEFTATDGTGADRPVALPAVVFVGGQSPIIGMRELTVAGVALVWNPAQGKGTLAAP